MPTLARLLIIPVALAAALPSVHAQDYPRNSPNVPAPSATQSPKAPSLPPVPRSDRPILDRLVGIALVGAPDKLRPEGVSTKGIDTGGIAMLDKPDFRASLASYLGKPVSLRDLNEIARTIVLYYRAHGHPLVDVTVPQQDITAGTVQFLVTEFRAGKIEVHGNHWFSDDQLLDALHVTPGQTVDGDRLLADIDWLNQNPFRHIDLVYRRAPEPATTDIELQTTDRFPVRVYAGYSNDGTPITGRDRWSLGFNWGNAFWDDQLLSYQFTSSNDFWHNRADEAGRPNAPTFTSHSVDWQIPLPWHDRLEIFGIYEAINPLLGTDFANPGVSGQASLRYIVPWRYSERVSGDWQVGYDFKTTNNNLDFGGVQISNTATDIHQIVLGFDTTIGDALGSTALSLTSFLSPGSLGDGNSSTTAFAASSPLATAHYVYAQIALDRLTRLPLGLTWAARLKAQLSDANLLPSERLGFGGTDFGRGYDEYAASGDDGVLLSNELRLPPWTIIPKDQAQPFAFWDYGSVRFHETPLDPATLEPESKGTELASAGLGLHYLYDRYFDFRLDYGFQLRTLPGVPGHSQFGNVSVTISY